MRYSIHRPQTCQPCQDSSLVPKFSTQANTGARAMTNLGNAGVNTHKCNLVHFRGHSRVTVLRLRRLRRDGAVASLRIAQTAD